MRERERRRWEVREEEEGGTKRDKRTKRGEGKEREKERGRERRERGFERGRERSLANFLLNIFFSEN